MEEAHMSLRQEVFDTVAKHLLTQGRRSMSDDAQICMYRGSDGLRCAVGALISDDHYSTAMEQKGPTDAIVRRAIARSLGVVDIDADTLDLLIDLQMLHDDTKPGGWEDELRDMAAVHGLSTGAIDGVSIQ